MTPSPLLSPPGMSRHLQLPGLTFIRLCHLTHFSAGSALCFSSSALLATNRLLTGHICVQDYETRSKSQIFQMHLSIQPFFRSPSRNEHLNYPQSGLAAFKILAIPVFIPYRYIWEHSVHVVAFGCQHHNRLWKTGESNLLPHSVGCIAQMQTALKNTEKDLRSIRYGGKDLRSAAVQLVYLFFLSFTVFTPHRLRFHQ